jgi:hypothetical protein
MVYHVRPQVGACEVLAQGLGAFPRHALIQSAGCAAVWHLSRGDAHNKDRLWAAGGCGLLTAALAAFPDDRDVQVGV